MIRSAASWPTLAFETTGWGFHLDFGSGERLSTHRDENLSLEITLGRGVERVMHGTDVVGVQVITPQ